MRHFRATVTVSVEDIFDHPVQLLSQAAIEKDRRCYIAGKVEGGGHDSHHGDQ